MSLEDLASTPFSEVLIVCNHMLDEAGFKFSFVSGAFLRGPRLVLMGYVGSKFCVWGNNWDLTLQRGGDAGSFFADFASLIAS